MGGPQLRDIVMPAQPATWPLAPGWWIVLVVLLAIVAVLLAWAIRRWRRRRRASRLQRLFDEQIAQATTGTQRLQLASACLRRALRASAPEQAGLTGAAWLELLDGEDPDRPFSSGPGRSLLDGPFRTDVDDAEIGPALALARIRFLQLAGDAHD